MREILIFVHGVSSDLMGRRHDEEYDTLYEGVSNRVTRASEWRRAEICKIEWGWNFAGRREPRKHEQLALAQANLGGRIQTTIDEAYDPTMNPGRFVVNAFRPLLSYGFSDMFYYVSSDGKASVRGALAEQVVAHLEATRTDPREPLSLTLLGHSAGSVIAFDFCFYLFAEEERGFVKDPSKGVCNDQIARLRTMALDGRLRIRRLITFGSPISMMACRNDVVVDILASRKRLNPQWHGLTQNPPSFGPVLQNARWINLWDKDDPIAFPVEPLMDPHYRAVKDVYVNVSSNIAEAHNLYWDHTDVHEYIAQHW